MRRPFGTGPAFLSNSTLNIHQGLLCLSMTKKKGARSDGFRNSCPFLMDDPKVYKRALSGRFEKNQAVLFSKEFFRYSEGVIPTFFLNKALKEDFELKPAS